MDRFTSMRIFVRIVQLGSFTAVAEDMGLTQSAVSKKMAALETGLAAKLLSRNSRQTLLTEIGSNYYEHCISILGELDEAEAQARELTLKPKGNLRVNVPLSFGQLHVVPHLPAFMKTYPDINIDLNLLDRRIDLIAEGVDVAFRIGHLSDSSLIAQKLGSTSRVIVASPGYVKAHGLPHKLEDLKHHNCLVYTQLATVNSWHFWHMNKEVSIRVNGTVKANTGYALHECALADMGIAVLPTWLVQPDIDSGRLQLVLTEFVPTKFPINALYPQRSYVPLKVRCFIDFYKALFADNPVISGN